jgi:hypothetical protein
MTPAEAYSNGTQKQTLASCVIGISALLAPAAAASRPRDLCMQWVWKLLHGFVVSPLTTQQAECPTRSKAVRSSRSMPVRTRRSKALEASKEAPDVQEADHAASEAATPPPAAQQGGSEEWSAEEEDMYGDDSDGEELEEVILEPTHPAAAADGEGEEDEEEAHTPPPTTGSKRKAPTKKQQQTKKKPKKEKPKKISQVRLCVTTVKKRYGLNDKDLEGLDVKYDYNPWGPHPMRLYKKGEVEQVAAAKAAQRQWEEDHKEELAAQRLAAQKQRKAEQMAQAKAAVERFAARAAAAAAAKQQQREGDDGVVLPVEVLEAVMGSFTTSSVRPDALMGVWGAATAIAQAAAASSTWYLASKAALQTLAAAVPPQLLAAFPQLPGPLGWEAWDAVVQEPASLKLDQLKEAARVLGTTISGTKPQLIVRLLERLGLDAPRALPARLHLALQEEKRRFLVDVAPKLITLAGYGNAVAAAAVSAPWQHWRALAAEFPTMAALQAAYQPAWAKQVQFSSLYPFGRQGGGVQQRQPRVGGGPGQGPAPPGGWCACGNAAKRGCSSHRCGTCCRRLGGGQCAVHFF